MARTASQAPAAAAAGGAASGPAAGDFSLLDQNGAYQQLYRSAADRAVVLYTHAIGCNVVLATAPKLEEMRRAYESKGVRFLMVDSNDGETRSNLQEYAARYKITIPILLDGNQLVAEQLGIDRTGEAILIDSRSRRVVFRGPVDDQTDVENQKPRALHHYLGNAIDALLAGQPIEPAVTRSPGCLITKTHQARPIAAAEYADRIAPILVDKCQACHREGGAAPWAMKDHQALRRWAAMMKEVVMTARMPPWHADPEIGHFQFDRSLSAEEKWALIRWIDAGAPRGAGPDPLAGAATAAATWPLGPPDAIVEVPPLAVPATGVVPYQYPTVPTSFGKDVWIRDAYLMTSNQAVTHHALAFLSVGIPSKLADNWIAVYSPGVNRTATPGEDIRRSEAGFFMPAGSTVQFQIHLAPNGIATEAKLRLGLYFHKTPPKYRLTSLGVGSLDFSIPPFAADYQVAAQARLEKPAVVFGLYPHMHVRGSHAKFTAIYPDGRREILLSVPHYHFNWQTIHYLDTPKTLPAGTIVQFTGAFDNSRDNPLNPDPAQTVTFGEQTTDEMFIGYLLQGQRASQ